MLPYNHQQKDYVDSLQREMQRKAAQERLANEVQPPWRWAVPNLQKILTQMIARFEAPETEAVPLPQQPSKLATDSGSFRIR
jgi:hypothetical protein